MIRRVLTILCLASIFAFGADVTGKWVASVEGRNGQTREVTYNLKSEGSALTGTVTGMRGDMEISDGKIEGDKISFKTKAEFNGNTFVMTYQGVVSGDELKLTQTREGSDRSREITAKRVK